MIRLLGASAMPGGIPPAALGGGMLVLVGLGMALWGARRAPAFVRPGGLALVLVGYFELFTALLWGLGPSRPVLSTAVLLGAVGVFRLMATFEAPSRRPSGKDGSAPDRATPGT